MGGVLVPPLVLQAAQRRVRAERVRVRERQEHVPGLHRQRRQERRDLYTGGLMLCGEAAPSKLRFRSLLRHILRYVIRAT